MSTYRVRYDRDRSGAWIASVPKVRGCHTYGRTLDQARERIREALSLFVDDAATAKLVDDVRLSMDAKALLVRLRKARKRAASEQQKASAVTTAAAKFLTSTMGLSTRDAGKLLDLSHQRVQQLVGKG
jgi:predicted RNase H-like HicB family nuclease